MCARRQWLERAHLPLAGSSLNKASNNAFGKPVAYQGEGGSIPFMAMLGEKFPGTQFVVTGVFGSAFQPPWPQ